MFGNRTLKRLNQMLDEAIAGTFQETNYTETKLSRLESKWKQFLWNSVLTKENLEREREKVKSLVSDISHQTKTPMTNVKLYSSLLEESLEQEKTQEDWKESREQNLKMVRELTRQTEKLEFLIHALTKMSRLETNLVEVRPKENEISRLLTETVETILPKAQSKQIKIRNTYKGSGLAFFDYKWTREALENVLDNGIKYSPGESEMILSVKEYELYMAVSVKDQGIGIREEEIPKIFERFYRSRESVQQDGVGIGLYLTREILRRENGYMKVKSCYGEGTEFILFLQRNPPV